MKRTILLVICVLLFTSCSAFRVHENNKAVKGIPFYIKKGMVKQETSYTRSWIEATINYYKINGDKKKLGTERSATVYISESTYNQIELLKIFVEADKAASSGFGAALTKFHTLLTENTMPQSNSEITPQTIKIEASLDTKSPTSLLQSLESNSSSFESIVDYTQKYYFNATIPPFGTTTSTAKIASDGTLSEASSTVDSTKLAESIPLKELLIDKWGLEKIFGAEKEVKTPRDFSFTLSVSTNGYKYTLTKYHKFTSELNFVPLKFSDKGISVSRAKFGDTKENDDEKDKKSISINGSIVLPEDE